MIRPGRKVAFQPEVLPKQGVSRPVLLDVDLAARVPMAERLERWIGRGFDGAIPRFWPR